MHVYQFNLANSYNAVNGKFAFPVLHKVIRT